jgi:hypothetical protein
MKMSGGPLHERSFTMRRLSGWLYTLGTLHVLVVVGPAMADENESGIVTGRQGRQPMSSYRSDRMNPLPLGAKMCAINKPLSVSSTEGLILDLNADQGVEVEDGNRVVKWTNQVSTFAARDFVKRDQGREVAGSGRPTLRQSIATLGGHNAIVFKRQELVNDHEDAFDHLITGNGYTWLAVLCVHQQVVQLKDVNSFFGNLRNGGLYEGIWGNVTDDNRVWIGSRNGITFGRWDDNNPMVVADEPLEVNRFYLVAGRMGAGLGKVWIELFINEPASVASHSYPVNPGANSSRMAIGQERDAVNHPGKESFDGELARFLMYERPLRRNELRQTMEALKKTYAIR